MVGKKVILKNQFDIEVLAGGQTEGIVETWGEPHVEFPLVSKSDTVRGVVVKLQNGRLFWTFQSDVIVTN